MIENLISKLSHRFNNENHLSDLVWTLCQISEEFQELFVCYFFEYLRGNHSAIELQREFSKGNSRPDFYFQTGQTEYLIEVKKYDTNDHFEQYVKDFPQAKRGWIANYQIQSHPEFKIRTWEEFHFHLEKEIANIQKPEAKDLISGFCEYLKSVCSIIKFQKMNLSNLQSLYYFNKMLPKVIEKERPGIEVKRYTSAKSNFEDGSGLFFSLKGKDKSEVYYPWFGVSYDEKLTCICIGFSLGWCKNIHEGIKNNSDFKGGKYFIDKYWDDNNYWFEMKKEIFEQFNNLSSAADQENLLNDFFTEVLESVRKYL